MQQHPSPSLLNPSEHALELLDKPLSATHSPCPCTLISVSHASCTVPAGRGIDQHPTRAARSQHSGRQVLQAPRLPSHQQPWQWWGAQRQQQAPAGGPRRRGLPDSQTGQPGDWLLGARVPAAVPQSAPALWRLWAVHSAGGYTQGCRLLRGAGEAHSLLTACGSSVHNAERLQDAASEGGLRALQPKMDARKGHTSRRHLLLWQVMTS